ncbi:MAG: hypothetical protein FWF44_05740 [Defluviitaleaceae bacterium]|nr:hypothetical protein [Defluviitaleaceae bacterium]
MDAISGNDIKIIRDLAKKQAEMSRAPRMDGLRRDWELHGAFGAGSRPMVLIETGTFADEVIPRLMECEGDEARRIEWQLRANIINAERFGDDTIVRDHWPVGCFWDFVPFGVDVKVEHTSDSAGNASLGHHFVSAVSDLEEDFHKLGKSRFSADMPGTLRHIDRLNELIGDILPARLTGNSLYSGPLMAIVHIMKMEDMYTAMYDYPELFHKMMDMLTNDYLEFFDLLETEKVLLPTLGDCTVCQGTYCYNDELPRTGEGLMTPQVWGYMDAQEASGLSPDMYMEFVAPYYRRIAERFGLLSYGCCEAVHPIWEPFLSGLANLRKVSVSPWCDEEFIGERLRGRRVSYLRKPSPNLLSVGAELDEDEVSKAMDKTVSAAKGCSLEIIQRDVYRINNTWEKVRRYVELIRKSCEKHQ